MNGAAMDGRPDDQLRRLDGNCDRQLLLAFAADALDSRDRAQMLGHLTRCRECREALALMTPDEGPPPPAAVSPKKAA